jgi:hypothetical protein
MFRANQSMLTANGAPKTTRFHRQNAKPKIFLVLYLCFVTRYPYPIRAVSRDDICHDSNGIIIVICQTYTL